MNKRDSLSVLLLFAIIAIIIYFVVRATLFFSAQYTPLEKIFAGALVLAEFFVLLHGFGYVLNIFKIIRKKEWPDEVFAPESDGPSVAILVAARHEPKEVLRDTFIALYNLNYKNKTIYLLDDSTDENCQEDSRELSGEYGLKLFCRKIRHGAKAGIINDCLKNINEKYVAIFDADQNPLSEFLNVLIPILEKDERLSFIQTPQFYSNIADNKIARAAEFQQAVFYEYICEGKSSSGSMFCCGTNVVFRTEALKQVGGLDESTVTEDFATSIKLHSNGWRSLYYNHVYAFGMGPESLGGYFKQQFRWAMGTISVFRQLALRLISRPFSLTFRQWWEYFLSSSYYLIGLAFFCLMVCPIAYILFRIPSFFARPEIYFLAFLPYIMLTMSIFYQVLKGRRYRPSDLLLGQLLGFCTLPVYMRAAVSALIGIKGTFGITEKGKAKSLSYIKLWPQIMFLFLNFIAFVWAMNRFIYEREPAVLVNGLWAFYHFCLLLGIFYFNEGLEK